MGDNSRQNRTTEYSVQEQTVLKLAKKKGILRPKDLMEAGIPRVMLTRLYRRKNLTKLCRGLYALTDADISQNHSFAEAAKRIPQGIICLLSALRFHEITTQLPFEVWIAIDRKARKPRKKGVSLRIIRFSGWARKVGIEKHIIENVPVYITSIARTVVDCFRYRNKIGLDVALEALREYYRMRKSRDELWKITKACRMSSVMRPYMEAMS